MCLKDPSNFGVSLVTDARVYVPVCLIRLGRGIERFDRPALGGFLARQSFAHLVLVRHMSFHTFVKLAGRCGGHLPMEK